MLKQSFEQNPDKYLKINIKESFNFINDNIIKKKTPSSLLDIGCAGGDFLSIIDPSIKAAGVDKAKTLIDLAKSRIDKPLFNFDITKKGKNFENY